MRLYTNPCAYSHAYASHPLLLPSRLVSQKLIMAYQCSPRRFKSTCAARAMHANGAQFYRTYDGNSNCKRYMASPGALNACHRHRISTMPGTPCAVLR